MKGYSVYIDIETPFGDHFQSEIEVFKTYNAAERYAKSLKRALLSNNKDFEWDINILYYKNKKEESELFYYNPSSN